MEFLVKAAIHFLQVAANGLRRENTVVVEVAAAIAPALVEPVLLFLNTKVKT
jgi:hypothetical protein